MPKLCQYCRHWKPLFTGEDWGVRSFADAPAEVRDDILAELRSRKARADADDYSGEPWEYWEAHEGYSTADIVGVEWPMWGECVRTDLNNEEATVGSLARAVDGSRYYAILRCRANFGCVQWEAING